MSKYREPSESSKASKIIDVQYEDVVQIPLELIANGTPLPEHYGRLIDADKFLAWLIFKGYIDNAKCGEVAEAIRKTTIIPATKEKSCENCIHSHGYDLECDIYGCKFEPKQIVTEENKSVCKSCNMPCPHSNDDRDICYYGEDAPDMKGHCEYCTYYTEHHYGNDGATLTIEASCSNKYGLKNGYQIHKWDFCSRFEPRLSNERR